MRSRCEPLTAARTASVDGRDVFVFDGLVSRRGIRALLRGDLAGRRSRAPRPRGQTARVTATGCARCRSRICRAPRCGPPPSERSRICGRASDSCRTASTPTSRPSATSLLTHVDALPNTRELTALWYLCEQLGHGVGRRDTVLRRRTVMREIAVSPKPGTAAAVRRRDPPRGQAAQSQLPGGALHLRDQSFGPSS